MSIARNGQERIDLAGTLKSVLCHAVGVSEKRTKFDRLQWNVQRLEKRDETRLEPNILDVLDLNQENAQTAGPVAVAIEVEEMIR